MGVLNIAAKISVEGRQGNQAARTRALALLRFLDAHYASLVAQSSLAVAGKHAASGIKSIIGFIAAKSDAPPPASAADYQKIRKESAANRARDPAAEVDVETFKEELFELSWVPVLTTCPFPDLPWSEGRSAVAYPRDVRPKEDLWLLSFFMGILDGDITSPELREAFGWGSSG